MCALSVSMRHAHPAAVKWSDEAKFVSRKSDIKRNECHRHRYVNKKHREPSVEEDANLFCFVLFFVFFLKEMKTVLMLWASGRKLTRGLHSVSVWLWVRARSCSRGVLWSRILSFYRILMSLLPPPLFTTDKEWNWSVCGTAASRIVVSTPAPGAPLGVSYKIIHFVF